MYRNSLQINYGLSCGKEYESEYLELIEIQSLSLTEMDAINNMDM